MSMKLTVLGSGTSHGIPVVGCSCPVCRSPDPRDRRMRCSLYIEGPAGEKAVIDTGPEFRLQALRAGITGLDAVFLTHAHADHLHGLDDIRPLTMKKPIPVYGNRETIGEFRDRFSYIWKNTQTGGGKPRIEPVIADKAVSLGCLTFTPIPVKHGILDILGWKIAGVSGGAAVYITEASGIHGDSLRLIGGNPPDFPNVPPEILFIGGLRERPHETHFNFEEALTLAAQTGAGRAYLTHLCHTHSHTDTEAYCRDFTEKRGLPPGSVGPAWDGLEIVL